MGENTNAQRGVTVRSTPAEYRASWLDGGEVSVTMTEFGGLNMRYFPAHPDRDAQRVAIPSDAVPLFRRWLRAARPPVEDTHHG